MKRILSLLILALFCFGLCACAEAKTAETNKYQKYDALIGAIESENYLSAIAELGKLFPTQQTIPVYPSATIPTYNVIVGIDPNQPDEPKPVGIEITMDNWQEYLEIVPREHWGTNAFGDIESVSIGYDLKIKEAYADRLITNFVYGAETKIDAEFSYDAEYYYCDIDFVNKTVTKNALDPFYTEQLGGANSVIRSFQGYNLDEGEYISSYYIWRDNKDIISESVPFYNDLKITRIQGTLYLEAE